MDSDGSDDEALRTAIAASLEDLQSSPQSRTNGQEKAVVDLTGDTDDDDVIPIYPKSKSVIGSETSHEASATEYAEDEDEDLRKAIALSLQATSSQEEPSKPEQNSAFSSEESQAKDQSEPKPTGAGLLGLNRKQMEQERLARLAKRKAEQSPAVGQREAKQPRTDPQSGASNVQPKQASTPSSVPSIQFPTGTVKKTFAFGYRRGEEDIKIEEVLQKSDLELAVLSSFMWDMDWVFSKFDIRSTRFIMVMQAKDDTTKQQYQSETATMTNLRLCFPPMDGQVNCMHSKLMLLLHPGYLRIVVPTANLVPYDWGEMGGIMENSVFIIDLPKKQNTTPTSEPRTNFYTDLVYFLKASTLHENIISKLDNFDFSKTAKFAFVHTIGGSHTGTSWKQTGYCGLGRSLESLGLRSSNPISLDFVTSSLGSINTEFMKCIYLAAQGDNGLTELTLRTSKSFPARNPSDPRHLIHRSTADEWKDRFRAYFPSQETVQRSKGGLRAAGTICFQSRWYEGGKFPRHVLRDCVSVRDGLLMHNKILYVRPDKPIPMSNTDTNSNTDTSQSECLGWAYVGSANLSESAWGRLVQDRSTKQPKLNCRNWECGVVIPVIQEEQSSGVGIEEKDKKKGKENGVEEESANLLDIFKGVVPVPMRLPGKRYGSSKKPWYFMEENT